MITADEVITIDNNAIGIDNPKIVKRFEDSIIPTRGSTSAAGFDLYSHDEVNIFPGETIKIDTGISIELPKGTFGAIFARSGLATKQGLRPANCVGVVDADYRGPVIVALHNDSNETREIAKGDRIAQLVVIPYYIPYFEITDNVEDMTNTERGEGGFGSTGTN